MTIAEVLSAARENHNAVGSTFWSDDSLYSRLFQVMLKVARQTRCIEGTDTQNTASGTADYTAPSAAFEISRVTYNGAKLQYIDLREYDSMNPSGTSSTGTPAYWLLYNGTITLYPTPDAIQTLKVWSFNFPTSVPTSATTLTSVFPAHGHDVLVTGLSWLMCPKDLGHPLTAMWKKQFADEVSEYEAQLKRKRRGDRFAVVKTEENFNRTDFGII